MSSISSPIELSHGGAGRERDAPILVRLEPRAGAAPSEKAPVRLYLGSEDTQYRAERVFFYALDRVRDPGRTYHVFVMRNMAGYERRGWRTEFTNYRFAIPDYAGGSGKAIYNDVDQIYFADPGQLFDLDLDSHGFLAVSAADTSVMLLDCARMATAWNLAAAQSKSKEQLLSAAAPEWGQLDPAWNARDQEFRAGRSKLLHFTAMHTQPWQPFPDDYAYRQHPLAELWLELERDADAAGYQVFTVTHPSRAYAQTIKASSRGQPAAPLSDQLLEFVVADGVRNAMVVTAGPPPPTPAVPAMLAIDLSASAGTWPTGKVESVIADNLLERIPAEDVAWTVDRLFASAQQSVAARIGCGGTGPADGPDDRQTLRPVEWWHAMFAAAAARYPGVAWFLEAVIGDEDSETVVIRNDGPRQFKTKPPKVWALLGHRAGDRAQLLALADALGWPYEVKELQYTGRHYLPNLLQTVTTMSLEPASAAQLLAPWPDIVLDCGKRSVPIARWIKKQSGGRTKLIHLGRPWGRFDWFDLIVTTPQYRIPPRANVQINALPMNRLAQQALDEAAAKWRDRFAALPRPWFGLIVGGRSPPYEFGPATARHLAEMASATAHKAGGSLLVTTSPRTGQAEADALVAAINVPTFVHRWAADSAENPYSAILALADELIVTGESASMLAEACSTGRPVAIFDLPRQPGLLTRAIDAVERLAARHGGRTSYRGTPQQQDRLARLHDRLIERGWFMPLRDFAAYQETLIGRGWAHRLGDPQGALPKAPRQDMDRTVARIRRLLLSDGHRASPT